MNTKRFSHLTLESRSDYQSATWPGSGGVIQISDPEAPGIPAAASFHRLTPAEEQLSEWVRSGAKRLFDCLCVFPALLLLAPVLITIALTVRSTSPGPVLFLQERIGRHGRVFAILKFRTMTIAKGIARHEVTTVINQQFTPIGPFLRRWKLDELPQLLNVLLGHMSLVGPRPLLPQHTICAPRCRPGITGAASFAFALEEACFAHLRHEDLNGFYHAVVLPAKRRLDAEYMERATFLSDLKLIAKSVLRRWDRSTIDELWKDR